MPNSMSRRQFITSASAAGALGSAAAYWVTAAPARAAFFQAKNDRPLVAAIGVGGRGLHDTTWAAKFGDVVAVCDVDLNHAERAKAALGGKPAVYQDYRKLLDAASGSRSDRQRYARPLAHGGQRRGLPAGKDLYAEKPLTLTIEEGQILSRVVRETGRIVQVGTQQRSSRPFPHRLRIGTQRPHRQAASGRRVVAPLSGQGWTVRPASRYPASLDWDLWQGQAPERPYCPERLHFKFRWWKDYAGGKITDWGQHHMDIAYWGMGMENSGPLEVEGKAFFPNRGQPDCYDNADRFVVRHEVSRRD